MLYVEGAEWIINQVLPRLPHGAVKLHLFGLGAERFAKRYPDLCIKEFVHQIDVV